MTAEHVRSLAGGVRTPHGVRSSSWMQLRGTVPVVIACAWVDIMQTHSPPEIVPTALEMAFSEGLGYSLNLSFAAQTGPENPLLYYS